MGNKAIKYRLYPTKEQAVLFHKTFGCCRKVYNLMLADAIKSYHDTGKFVSGSPASYKKDYPYLKEVDSLALAYKWTDLRSAFNACFDKSRKRRNGFPKFKGRTRESGHPQAAGTGLETEVGYCFTGSRRELLCFRSL